ncbi:MAG: hypothetical protein U0840_11865 [Gemmataceae bacterium]
MPAVMLFTFALTLFLSATLMFFVELMVGKMMLPLLGGTPAVWNTCMVFYQAVLLAGYAYSHWTTQWLGARGQARLQIAVLFLPFLAFASNYIFSSGLLAPNQNLILGNEGNPIPALLLVLSVSVGLPMFVISTSAPLLQRWFSSTDHPSASDPYFLYGASNFGSMLGLWGYILLVEPYLTLRGQQLGWVFGFTTLAILVVVCAFQMWRSRPAPVFGLASVGGSLPAEGLASPGSVKESPASRGKERATESSIDDTGPTTRPVTWLRRLHWIALALVPSSLMLGATTYITTDIAAIPLLWVLPLTLYLLTFIIVFAHISPLTQSIVTLAGLGSLVAVTVFYIMPMFVTDDSVRMLIGLLGLGIFAYSLQLVRVRDTRLIHRVMIMIMPLLLLLLLFMMLSDIRPGVVANVLLHVSSLFIVSMVCHGELARDRPTPEHLTEFFLLMSLGGVLGGLFNALFAPVAFNSLVEYPLMMMLACLLLPPLGLGRGSIWARRADLALALVFLLVGGMLLYLRSRDNIPDLAPLAQGPWKWGVTAIALALVLGALATWRGWSGPPPLDEEPAEETPERGAWVDGVLDLVLPAALLVLVLGLYWGLPAKGVEGRLVGFAKMVGLDVKQFRVILTFGLPAVLCYTFVERSLRFGLGVGAIMLAASFSNIVDDSPLHQERSFFGVLRVEGGANFRDDYVYPFKRLVHGTTLHGKQFLQEELRDTPLTYYHRTGPVGNVFRAYNTDPSRAMAVIGLGTGTMSCYGLPGQTLDFYDIDPVVVDIAYDSNEYFTFVEDAEERGVNVNLVLGDARLTFEPKGVKTRLKPLHKRSDEPTPTRKFGDPISEDFKYRLIVVDAFSSDAIPVHLITKEAVKIYFDRLEEDGIVLMHISNRYLDLQPVLANIAEELGFIGYHMSDDDNEAVGKNRAHWVALARKKEHLQRILERPRWENDPEQLALLGLALWPSQGATLQTTSRLAWAFQNLAEQQSRLLAREEGRKEDLLVASTWVPLDQMSWLNCRNEEYSKKVEAIQAQLKNLEKPLSQALTSYNAFEKPIKDLTKQAEDIEKDLKQLMGEMTGNQATDNSQIKRRLTDLEKRKADLMTQKKKLQEKLDEAAGPKDWLEKAKASLEKQRERYEKLIALTPDRIKMAQRVGVWTDDYSNLLSVFSW